MELTYMEKRVKWAKGLYIFDVPPVCTARWSACAWVDWIDSHGRWL